MVKMELEPKIIRPVQVLRGYRNIAKVLRTSENRIRDFLREGAPIVFDGDVPVAESAELWAWYRKKREA